MIPMTEADLQLRITDLCDLLGLAWHHEVDSRRSKAGFPDLVIVGCAGQGVVFAELKKDGGRVRPEQQWWQQRLAAAGVEAHIWTPSDWPTIETRIKELAGR